MDYVWHHVVGLAVFGLGMFINHQSDAILLSLRKTGESLLDSLWWLFSLCQLTQFTRRDCGVDRFCDIVLASWSGNICRMDYG